MSEPRDIDALFSDGAAIDAALAKAARMAWREARLLRRPLIVWRDGRVIAVPADELPDEAAVFGPPAD